MFEKLEVMRMAQSMAAHASSRQQVIAQNVANADTPRYRARDVASFAETYQAPGLTMRQTRAGHTAGLMGGGVAVNDQPGREAPNGNTVSLETEMMKAGEVRHQHQMALSIYRTALDILRTSAGVR